MRRLLCKRTVRIAGDFARPLVCTERSRDWMLKPPESQQERVFRTLHATAKHSAANFERKLTNASTARAGVEILFVSQTM